MSGPAPTVTPLRLLILALGGEGGGVLMNWVVAAARRAGCTVQASSVPGVAQRTGSTSYYIEIADAAADPAPTLGLVPMPARVDVVLASELMEAARAMERGFVSPDVTTLIASTSRVYATAEKIEMGDGRFDADRVAAAAEKLAKRLHLLDLDTLARDNKTFISATMFGALAGSGALPWSVEQSRAVLGEGKSAAASRQGFDAAVAAIADAKRDAPMASEDADAGPPETAPAADWLTSAGPALKEICGHGHDRACDFQDADYGALYLDRVARLAAAASADTAASSLALQEAARRLALWMAYEDVSRVADLKTRPERFARIRDEVQLAPGQVLQVSDYLKPQPEEIAAILPAGLGRRLRRHADAGGWVPFVGEGIRLRTTSVSGYWLLRTLAQFRRIRRRSLRYAAEQAAIEDWLGAMETSLKRAPAFAEALAELPRVLKGYSDTQSRGQRAYDRIMDHVVRPAMSAGTQAAATRRLRDAIAAALSDADHAALDAIVPGDAETPDAEPAHAD